MSGRMRWTIIISLLSVLFWTLNLIQLAVSVMLPVAPIGIPLVGLAWYASLYTNQRKVFNRNLAGYSWVWLPPVVLAGVFTHVVYLASQSGLAIRGVDWGYEGTPWMYVREITFLIWLAPAFVVGCCAKSFRRSVGEWFVEFCRTGGVWLIAGKNNAPANRWAVITLVVAHLASLQGVPPVFDPTEMKDQLRTGVHDVTSASPTVAVQEKINFVSQNIYGEDLWPVSKVDESQPKPAVPHYRYNWFWLKCLRVLIPLSIISWLLTRRDGVMAGLEHLATLFQKDRSHGVGSNAEKVAKMFTDGEQKESSNFLVRWLKGPLGFLLADGLVAAITGKVIARKNKPVA